jgi:hypothetical protein
MNVLFLPPLTSRAIALTISVRDLDTFRSNKPALYSPLSEEAVPWKSPSCCWSSAWKDRQYPPGLTIGLISRNGASGLLMKQGCAGLKAGPPFAEALI